MPVPGDFPRRPLLGAVCGAVPKLLVHQDHNGCYSAFVDDETHAQAYTSAEDIARQLKVYALRKERENPDWTRDFNLARIRRGLEQKVRGQVWDFTDDEQEWIMKRLAVLLEE